MLHSHQMASVTMATIMAIVEAEYVHAPYTALQQNTSAETMRRDAAFTPLHKISTRMQRSARIIIIVYCLNWSFH